jgi:hypothetical protein
MLSERATDRLDTLFISGLIYLNFLLELALAIINNTYSTGNMAAGAGSTFLGGLVGLNNTTVNNSFWDIQVTLTSAGANALANVSTSLYAITPSAAIGGTFAASNYTINYVNGVLAVDPATLIYTANTGTMTYGSSVPALSGTVTGFVNSQTQASATTGTLAFTSTATSSSNVGNYAINGSGLTANNSNYLFTQAASNATALIIIPSTPAIPTEPLKVVPPVIINIPVNPLLPLIANIITSATIKNNINTSNNELADISIINNTGLIENIQNILIENADLNNVARNLPTNWIGPISENIINNVSTNGIKSQNGVLYASPANFKFDQQNIMATISWLFIISIILMSSTLLIVLLLIINNLYIIIWHKNNDEVNLELNMHDQYHGVVFTHTIDTGNLLPINSLLITNFIYTTHGWINEPSYTDTIPPEKLAA